MSAHRTPFARSARLHARRIALPMFLLSLILSLTQV
ncbi:jg13935, partial [Pararge aegeria aegeria]